MAFVGLNFGSAMSNISTQIIEMMASDPKVAPFDPGSPTITSALSVSMLIGSMAGSLGISFFVSRFGRKRTAVVCGFCASVLNSLQFIPVSWVYLLIVRICFGVFSASINTVVPVWLGELVPDHIRGSLSIGFQAFTGCGQVVSGLIMLLIGPNEALWRLSFIPSTICPLVTACCCLALAEAENTGETRNDVSWKDFFCVKQFRRICLNSILLPFAQQATGSNAVIIYATQIFADTFKDAGEIYSPIYGALLISGLNTVTTMLSMLLVTRIGRKTLNMTGYAICLLSLGALILYYAMPAEEAPSALLVTASLSFVFGFAIGPGPVLYVLNAELFPRPLTIKASSVNFTTNWTINIMAVLVYPFFQGNEWGAYTLYLCLTIVPVAILFFTVPETKGLTLAQISELLLGSADSNETDGLIDAPSETIG